MYSGTGFYSLAEASRLVRVPSRSITRWLYGYPYVIKKKGEKQQHFSSPLWSPEYSSDAFAEKVIGFRDLLELRIVRQFVENGLPLLVVRRCLDTARDVYGDEYPMTTHRFATDGSTLFMQVMRQGVIQEMLDLRKRQLVFSDIFKPSLFSGIEYEGESARRWYPEGNKRRNIVLDPKQQFGKPIVAEIGVPTEALYSNYQVEGADNAALSVVARIFDMPLQKVQAAVQFEKHLRLAA